MEVGFSSIRLKASSSILKSSLDIVRMSKHMHLPSEVQNNLDDRRINEATTAAIVPSRLTVGGGRPITRVRREEVSEYSLFFLSLPPSFLLQIIRLAPKPIYRLSFVLLRACVSEEPRIELPTWLTPRLSHPADLLLTTSSPSTRNTELHLYSTSLLPHHAYPTRLRPRPRDLSVRSSS